MSNKITVVTGGRTAQGRLRPFGDITESVGGCMLYWRSHRWNGHVDPRDEGISWLRGWDLDQKTRDALVVSAALSR